MTKRPPAAPARRRPVVFHAVVRPLVQFFRLEAASGIVLMIAAPVALLWANLAGPSYRALFELGLGVELGKAAFHFSFRELVNDGLMSIFFFVVGMEIKRELVVGELRTLGRASLPAIAAVGGMAVPALLYLLFTRGTPGEVGWGIPVATDIAFCIGVLTLLKSRVSHALIVFVTALAIFDDIGGILVIGLFYGNGLHLDWLFAAAGITAGLFVLNRLRIGSLLLYGTGGLALWYALHHAGIHATIAGVVLGLMVPARSRRPAREILRELTAMASSSLDEAADEDRDAGELLGIEEQIEGLEAPLERFVHLLHPYVAFGIMPLFALANAGVPLGGLSFAELLGPVSLGAAVGLLLGKPLGIFTCAFLAVKLGVAPMPGGASRLELFGVSVVAGIGFTVSLFIANLAFSAEPALLDQAKVGILAGSILAAAVGALVLLLGGRARAAPAAAAGA